MTSSQSSTIFYNMIIKANNLPNQTVEFKGDQIIVTNNEKLDDQMKHNYELRKSENNGFSVDREFRRIASVPNSVFFEWMKEFPEIVQGDRELRDKTLKKLLRRPENAWVKTVDGGI